MLVSCKNILKPNLGSSLRYGYLRKSVKDSVETGQGVLYFSNKNDESDGGDHDKSTPSSKSQEALKKLNDLLQKMVNEDVVSQKSQLELAKPKSKRGLRPQTSEEVVHKETVEQQMVKAVKDVAESVGGDVKQTESELLLKLLNSKAESSAKSADLSEIVKGMKIDRESKTGESYSRAQQVREILNKRLDRREKSEVPRRESRSQTRFPPRPPPILEKIDLFGSEPLGIFKDSAAVNDAAKPNKTWDELYNKELKLAVTHPPANYFQEMILWTEQGKLWKFPIDNEQGLEKEQNVYFAEHIFLEKHLDGWCPPRGPLRHFMELVCVGLSKNPYITVEAKKEHIAWYRDYFEEKKKLLLEVGAITDGTKTKQETKKALPDEKQ